MNIYDMDEHNFLITFLYNLQIILWCILFDIQNKLMESYLDNSQNCRRTINFYFFLLIQFIMIVFSFRFNPIKYTKMKYGIKKRIVEIISFSHPS